jgi:molybdenum cofactor cytidylyltransferase
VIAAVVLAAGESRRMGQPKALCRLPDGKTFVDRIVTTVKNAGIGTIVVVVGPPHDAAIRRALPPGVGYAHNPRPERGMLSSVQAGVLALPFNVTAALIWPVDVPFPSVETVRFIKDTQPGKIIVPTAEDKGGHPLRVPRAFFSTILELDLTVGLRGLIEERKADVVRLAVGDSGILRDIDTPEDLTGLR